MKIRDVLLVVCCAGVVGVANAGEIVQPVAAWTDIYDAGNYGYDPNWAVNKSGLTIQYASGVDNFDTVVANAEHYAGWLNGWVIGSGSYVGNFNVDLGASYTIESMAMWNQGGPAAVNGQVGQFKLLASESPDFSSAVVLGSFVGSGDPWTPLAEVFTFAPTSARYVRIEVESWTSPNECMIGELAFEGTIPAPGAALSLLAGGAMLARRRR